MSDVLQDEWCFDRAANGCYVALHHGDGIPRKWQRREMADVDSACTRERDMFAPPWRVQAPHERGELCDIVFIEVFGRTERKADGVWDKCEVLSQQIQLSYF